jgi:hypothetical protein
MASTKSTPSQKFVPIKEIRDGVLILKDGGVRAILLASSVNLALKSEEEQRATIAQFQAFFNSLDFSIQIVIQSRKHDIRPYLMTLEERLKEQKEELLRVQTREYIEFIRTFTEKVNIMKKHFFVVIPFANTVVSSGGGKSGGLFGSSSSSGKSGQEKSDEKFEETRSQLEQRISLVASGLNQVGVKTKQLGTQDVIELFHGTFNPGDAQKAMRIEGVI